MCCRSNAAAYRRVQSKGRGGFQQVNSAVVFSAKSACAGVSGLAWARRSAGSGWGARLVGRASIPGMREHPRCHPGRKCVSAGGPGPTDPRVRLPGSRSRTALRASGMTIPMMRQRMAGGGEPACDGCVALLRDASFASPRHGDFLRLAACFSQDAFLETVARPSGQNLRRWRRVTLRRTAARAHLEGCGDD